MQEKKRRKKIKMKAKTSASSPLGSENSQSKGRRGREAPAFLSVDCLAACGPGWLASRIKGDQRGALVISPASGAGAGG